MVMVFVIIYILTMIKLFKDIDALFIVKKAKCQKCGKRKKITVPPLERGRMKDSDFCRCKLTMKEINAMG